MFFLDGHIVKIDSLELEDCRRLLSPGIYTQADLDRLDAECRIPVSLSVQEAQLIITGRFLDSYGFGSVTSQWHNHRRTSMETVLRDAPKYAKPKE